MESSLSRRKFMTAGMSAVGGAVGLAGAARLADRCGLIPPDWSGIYGPGRTLTYACQRILTSHRSLAREFSPAQISKVAPVSGGPPETERYQRLAAGAFSDWQLVIDGLVARPTSFSLAQLKHFPACTQITEQICEEGWSFIAEWTGVPLYRLMDKVGVRREARFAVAFALDDRWESLDMQDAWHPQTLIAYGMNGQEISTGHGAPARIKVPRQLGYKHVKYLARITFTDAVKKAGKGSGAFEPEHGPWYAGI